MIDEKALAAYFSGRDLKVLIEQLKRRELTDPISEDLSEGLKRVLKERDVECFTLPHTWRFATRRDAARSRIAFLSEYGPYETIIDASCGIGLMLRELATLKPTRLIGFEIDPTIAHLARANLKLHGVQAEVHTIDSTSDDALRMIADASLVFCDPERAESAQARTLDESTPRYTILSEHAKRLAYETSPRTPIAELPGTVELYSERRRHARTTIYTGFGIEERRVVSDRNETIQGLPKPIKQTPPGSGRFIELLDTCIARAELAHLFGGWHESHGKHLRLTDRIEPADFIDPYQVIATGELATIKGVAQQLTDFNRIALRYPVPAGSYWREANAIRKSSTGSRTIHVFRINDGYVLAEPMP